MTYSTTLRCFLLATLLGFALVSCQTKTSANEDSTPPTDSPATGKSASGDINSTASGLLKTIVGSTDEGVIRGIAFGDPVSKVRATETFEMFEDSLRHVGYTFETNQLETIDVLYYFTPEGRMVDKITVDV